MIPRVCNSFSVRRKVGIIAPTPRSHSAPPSNIIRLNRSVTKTTVSAPETPRRQLADARGFREILPNVPEQGPVIPPGTSPSPPLPATKKF